MKAAMKGALLSVFLLAAALAAVADVPRLEYSKFFKGSVPEFVSITIEKSGQVIL